jgi:hypothetical protein
MAIAYASAGAISTVNPAATTNNVPYPSTVNEDDLLVLFISTNGGAVTAPSGWTEIYRETALSNPKGGLFIKVADGTETGSQAVTTTSTVSMAQMFRYTGVDPTTPQDATATNTVNTASTTSAILPEITLATAGAMLIYVAAPNSSTTQTSSTTGTERCDFGATTGGKGGGLFDEIVSSSGATGTRTITLSASRANWGAMLALRPAATSGSEASAALSGSGTLTAPTVTPDFIRTPDVSGSGTLAGVGVYGSPSTSFDDGTLQDWSASTAGSGAVEVLTAAKHDGTHGVRVTTPADTVDAASISKTLSPVTLKARIAGWWRVTTEGLSTTNVSFARFMNGSTILAGLYRQNVTAGPNVWLRTAKADGTGFYFTGTGFRMELGEWVYVEFEWNHNNGTPLVKLNGTTYLNTAMTDWLAASQMDTIVIGAPETGKSGVWEADTLRINTYQAALDLSGSGTLTANAVPGSSVSAGLSGSGSLTSTTTSGSAASANLSGSGTLSSSVVASVSVNAALSGQGSLTAEQGDVDVSAAPPLSGSGTLTRNVVAGFTAGMSSSSTGTLGATVVSVSQSAAVAFSGSGTLAGSQTGVSGSRSAALSGSGTLDKTVTPAASSSASLSGSGTLTTDLSNSFNRSAALSGSGSLTASVTPNVTVSRNLSGSGTLSGNAGTNGSASVDLSGGGTLQGFLTSVGMSQSAALSGSGTLSSTYYITRLASAAMSGSGTLAVTVTPSFQAVFDRESAGTMSPQTAPHYVATASLSGSGSLGVAIDDGHNYTVKGTLAAKRWSGDIGLKRWKGSL